MAAKAKNRQFPTAFKLKAIKRAEGGEGVLPVARKLGISRKLLHDWIKAWKAHGPEGLNRKRGPKPGPRKLKPLDVAEKRSALAQASARIVVRWCLSLNFLGGCFAGSAPRHHQFEPNRVSTVRKPI